MTHDDARRDLARIHAAQARIRGTMAKLDGKRACDCAETDAALIRAWAEGFAFDVTQNPRTRPGNAGFTGNNRTGSPWLLVEILVLEAARREGASSDAIAAVLARPEPAVRARVSRLGLGRPGRPRAVPA